MLTIGKIGGQGGGHWRTPDYYTHQVAQGAEDYYSGKGEAPGLSLEEQDRPGPGARSSVR